MKTLIYDLESAPAIGLYFGKPYDVQIAKTIQHEFILGFAYKWLGERKIHTCYIWDFDRYLHEPTNDINVIKKWAELVGEADIMLGHNSDRFDYRMMFGRLMLHRLPPVAEPLMIDTKKAVKRVAEYQSYKLDELSKRSSGRGKLEHEGIDLWWKCMNGDIKAQKKMVAYNKVDVKRTEELYLWERPYMKTHPNLAVINDEPEACPKCLSTEGFHESGSYYTATGKKLRFRCLSCRTIVKARTGEKIEKPQYVL